VVVENHTGPLTYLRFADDFLLFGTSPVDAVKNIGDLNLEASKFGLKLHMGKTALLINHENNCPTIVPCCGQALKVVGKDETERYFRAQAFNDCSPWHRLCQPFGCCLGCIL